MATENVPCEVETVKEIRILVARKHGKLRGYLGKEITEAVKEHSKKLEKELEGAT